jgi:hypothetical protein
MKLLTPTPLEFALLRTFYDLHGAHGFPPPEEISVRNRENTGAGRYVDLNVEEDSELEDGYLDLGGQFIEMEGVPSGLMAVVLIKDRRPYQIEIAVYGDDPWDGHERRWSIV